MIEIERSRKWQEDVTAQWTECARAGFPKYVVVHQKRARNKAGERIIVKSLQPSLGQAVEMLAANGIEDDEAQKFPQARTKTDLNGLYNRCELRENEAMERSVLKKLELTAEEMLKPRAVS